jgi:hypothetical protein
MSDDNLVKILFRFYSDILDEETTETMWAEVVDKEKGYYKLDNIPFYAPLIASDDIVFAEYDEEELMLTYRKTIEYSGNSTIHVIIMNNSYEINIVRKVFEGMGCESERKSDKYFALEIPAKIEYTPIKLKLEEMEKAEIIGYAETCLSEKHQY